MNRPRQQGRTQIYGIEPKGDVRSERPKALKPRASKHTRRATTPVEASLSRDRSTTKREKGQVGLSVWEGSARWRSHSLAARLLLPVPELPRMPKGKEGFPHQKRLQRIPRGVLECNHKGRDGTVAVG